MKNQKLDEVIRMLDEINKKICADSFNLTRDDHDAIDVQIQNLKKYIKDRYHQRMTSNSN